jgi:hypothetical protein
MTNDRFPAFNPVSSGTAAEKIQNYYALSLMLNINKVIKILQAFNDKINGCKYVNVEHLQQIRSLNKRLALLY